MNEDTYDYDRRDDRPLDFEDVLQSQDRGLRWSQEPIDSTEGSDDTVVPATGMDLTEEILEDPPETPTTDTMAPEAAAPLVTPTTKEVAAVPNVSSAPTIIRQRVNPPGQTRQLCPQCGEHHRELAQDCPWVSQLVAKGSTAYIYPAKGGAVPDIIRLDVNPCISLRKYLANYTGQPLTSLKDAYERSVRRFPIGTKQKIPHWYRNDEVLPDIVYRSHARLCNLTTSDPTTQGNRPSLLSRIERSTSRPLFRTHPRAHGSTPPIQRARIRTTPKEVFITGMTDGQFTLSDGQGNTFTLSRGAVNAWSRQ